MDDKETFLSVKEVHNILHLSRSNILTRCKSGEISSVRIGNKFLISKTAFYDWLGKQAIKVEEKKEDKKEVPASRPIVPGRSGFDCSDGDTYYKSY